MTTYSSHAQNFLDQYGFTHPIIQAPMAGVPVVDLVTAVCQAGGLGSIGAEYMSVADLDDAIVRIKQCTTAPFSVNLFFYDAPPKPAWNDANPALRKYVELYEINGLETPHDFVEPTDDFAAKIDLLVKHRIPIVSFVFGIPTSDILHKIKAYDGKIWLTVSNVEEARDALALNPDALIVQGVEGGGHRATFNPAPALVSTIPLKPLLHVIRAETNIPLIAAGGIMTGQDMAEIIALGASAAQMGTAFLACPESGINDAWRQALLTATGDDTVITPAFSGRMARGIRNAHTIAFEKLEMHIPPFPYTNALTGPLRAYVRKNGIADYQSLWAGQGVGKIRFMSVNELMSVLIQEMA